MDGDLNGKAQVVVAGGGIAGLEAVLALRDLAGDVADVTLVAPEPDFIYKPLVVEEPFSLAPAERHELEPMMREVGARFVRQPVVRVDAERRSVGLRDGGELEYDALVVCIGGRARPVYTRATTFWATGDPLDIDALLEQAAASPSRRLAFIVPPGVSWPLPLYELALMSERRARNLDFRETDLVIATPETAPLVIFGQVPSDAVAALLAARGLDVMTSAYVTEDAEGLVVTPAGGRLEAGAAIALPRIEGQPVEGLPADEHRFLPIDEHARVKGLDRVYAAGDGTNFPIKQGGIGTQQADAAAEHIAARFGAPVEPEPFRPVLRGKLITGEETLSIRADVGGGGGEGRISGDYLWSPPHKVGGRYLGAFLSGTTPHELDAEDVPLDVEVSLPVEWHREPLALDPYRPPD